MSRLNIRDGGRQERFCEHPLGGAWLRNCIQPTATAARILPATDKGVPNGGAFFFAPQGDELKKIGNNIVAFFVFRAIIIFRVEIIRIETI